MPGFDVVFAELSGDPISVDRAAAAVDAELGATLRANLGAAPLSDAEAANKIG